MANLCPLQKLACISSPFILWLLGLIIFCIPFHRADCSPASISVAAATLTLLTARGQGLPQIKYMSPYDKPKMNAQCVSCVLDEALADPELWQRGQKGLRCLRVHSVPDGMWCAESIWFRVLGNEAPASCSNCPWVTLTGCLLAS